jgi:hypothetical protein
MNKTLLLLTLCGFVGLTSNSQKLIKTSRGSQNQELKIKTSSSQKDMTPNLVCNNSFVAGTTMDLNFTLNLSTNTEEYGTILELSFPNGITPNSGTDPLMAVDFGQPTAELVVIGQLCTWTSGDLTFGGIVADGSAINFTVNVDVAGDLSGTQNVNFSITGDGFGEDNPTVLNSEVSILDNNIPYADVEVISTLATAAFDKGNDNFYNTANCDISQLEVACEIVNLGNTPLNNFEVSYQLNDGIAVNETVETEILSGDTSLYVFWTPIDNLTQDVHEIRSYATVASDVNVDNDTSVTITLANSFSTDLSSSNYENSITSDYDINSLYRTWSGIGAPFNVSSIYFNTSPYALFFSPNVEVGYPEATYTTYAFTACLDVEAGSEYVVKYYRKSNEALAGSAYTVNGETAILVGDNYDLTMLDTLRDFTSIIPNASSGTWELDSVIYTADSSGTKYFSIAGRATTSGTLIAPVEVGNVRIDDIEVYLLSSVGIDENSVNEFAIYPNPSNDLVNVSLKKLNDTISLLSIDGKLIESREVSSSVETFNVKSLKSGVYLIQVGQTIQKLLVR